MRTNESHEDEGRRARASAEEREERLDASIRRMARTPGSGIEMCHAQGKTAVYLSDDKTCLIEHPPHGPIKRIPR